jgi:hypothetical protein
VKRTVASTRSGLDLAPRLLREGLDPIHDRVAVSEERRVVVSRQFHERRTRDPFGDVAALLDLADRITGPVED